MGIELTPEPWQGDCRTLLFQSFNSPSCYICSRPPITVAILGAIESLFPAVVSDRMNGDKHNPNVELITQGVANFVSRLFGGLPARPGSRGT